MTSFALRRGGIDKRTRKKIFSFFTKSPWFFRSRLRSHWLLLMLFWMRWKFAYYLAFILDVYDFKFIIFLRPTSTKTRSLDEIFIFSLLSSRWRASHSTSSSFSHTRCRKLLLLNFVFCSALAHLLLLIRRSCQSTFPRRHIFLLFFLFFFGLFSLFTSPLSHHQWRS